MDVIFKTKLPHISTSVLCMFGLMLVYIQCCLCGTSFLSRQVIFWCKQHVRLFKNGNIISSIIRFAHLFFAVNTNKPVVVVIKAPKSCPPPLTEQLRNYKSLAQSQTTSANQGFCDVSKLANYLLFETISAEQGLYEQIIYLLNLTYNKHTNKQRILKEKLYVIYINCLGHFNLMIRSNMTKRFTK